MIMQIDCPITAAEGRAGCLLASLQAHLEVGSSATATLGCDNSLRRVQPQAQCYEQSIRPFVQPGREGVRCYPGLPVT